MDKNVFLIGLSESDRTDFGRIDFDDQSHDQQVFSAIWSVESEVNSGGFESYFAYSAGNTVNFTPRALEEIGAQTMASIVRRALDIVGRPLPGDDDERRSLIDDLSDKKLGELESLDSEFYEYPDNLTQLLFQFVAARPGSFGPVPQSD
ncbi:MAG: DMP19 family protein [Coriobacteriia bacterium]